MTEFDHLDTDIKLLTDITITEPEKQDLIIAGAETGLYCTQCTNCLQQCPKRLPVNDLMRAYMYAYGYSNPKMAFSLLSELGTGADPCGDCNACSVNCTKRFNVREKISDISRLISVPEDFLV
jgi:succinate dehydrogenase/fumarate reductase-like Fe-S protein